MGKPVEGLGGEDAVNRRVLEWDLFRGPSEQLGLRAQADQRRISGSGSTATTCANSLTSKRVSLPVPAPTSRTVAEVDSPGTRTT